MNVDEYMSPLITSSSLSAVPVPVQPPVSPALSCYPEIFAGPERTDVKGAHVTHFLP